MDMGEQKWEALTGSVLGAVFEVAGLSVSLLVNYQRSQVEWRRIPQTGMATDEHG